MAVRTGRKRAARAQGRTSVLGSNAARGRDVVGLARLLKRGRLRDGLLATSCLVIASAIVPAAGSAQSLPQGGVVVGGSATIALTSPTQLTINQSTLRAVTNWNSFSIGSGNSVKINQPGASSVSVNQVVGSSVSTIFGSLSSNGQVVVANPNGVWFGAGSHVDVAGLVATTATMSASSVSSFMAGGKLNFDTAGSPNASVVNDGTITIANAGLAAFVAPGVANRGVIQARLGKVQLASGNTYTLDLNGDGLVQLAVSDKVLQQALGPDGKPLSAAVVNSGQILADGGSVYLTANVAKNVVNNVIDMSGVVEARAATVAGGDIILSGGDAGQVAVSGTLDASGLGAGQTGGTVKVLGQNVALNAGATINVSGDAGGGAALIGGNFHGAGPEPNAQTTYVDAAATIAADSVTYGNGGNVAVWADNSTVFNGTVTARGGALGGDGGYVETSGKQFLSVQTGFVNTLAPLGRVGTWLLDPQNITVVATGGTATLGDVGSFGTNAGVTEQINATTIAAAASNVVLQATNDITFGANIGMQNNGVGITAQAGDSIAVNAGITTRGGAITLSANDPGGGTQSGSGSITISALLDTTNGQTVAGGAVNLTVNGGTGNIALLASGGNMQTGGGAVTMSAPLVSSSSTASIFTNGLTGVAGAQNGGAVNITTTSSGVIVGSLINAMAASGGSPGNVTISSAGAVSLGSGLGNITLPAVQAGALSLSGSSIFVGGTITSFAQTVALTSGSGGIDLIGAVSTTGGAVDLTANNGGNITTTAGITSGAGAVTIAGNALTLASVTTSGQTIGVTSGSGGMVLDGVLSTTGSGAFGGAVNVAANGGGNVGLGVGGQTIRTAGGAVTIDAGSVTSVASGSNAPGISTAATNGTGGVNGGAINITTTVGGVTIGGTLTSSSGAGGTAGNITIASAGDVTLGAGLTSPTSSSAVLATGFAAGASTVAGNGGNVSISGGNISLFSNVSSSGGTATAAGSTSNGGNAGTITLNATGAVTIGTVAEGNLVGLLATGGNSLNGAGGNAGTIFVSGNTIAANRIQATGGNTISVAGGGSDGAAGNGASITLAATASSGNTITLYGNAQSPTDTSASTTSSFTTVNARSGLQGDSSVTSLDGTVGGTGGSITIGGAAGGMLAGTAVIRLVDDSSASSFNGGATVRIIAGGAFGNPNGSILINGPVEATTANDESLRMHAYNASITVAGDIGGQTTLNSLVFGTGRSLGPNEGSITLQGPVTIGTQIVDQRASGSLSFNGFVTTPAFTLQAGTLALAMNAGANFNGPVSGLSSIGSLTLGGTFGFNTVGASVDQTIPLTLSGPTTINASGGITLAAVDGTSAGAQALTLNAGNAQVTLDGALGGSVPLGAVTVNAGSGELLGGNITTAGGAVHLSSPAVLTANVDIDTTAAGAAPAGAAISFNGFIDGTTAGGQALALNGGTGGAVTLPGPLGSSTPLGAVTIDGASVALGGSITTAGGAVTINPAVILDTRPIIDTTAGGAAPAGANITFGSTVDAATPGGDGLELHGGTGGVVTLNGNVGSTASLADFQLLSGSSAILGGDITTTIGAVTIVPAALLERSVTLSSLTTQQFHGGLLLGPIDGTTAGGQALTLNAGNNSIQLNGSLGGVTPLGAVSISGFNAQLAGGIITAGGAITVNPQVSLTTGAIYAIDTTASGTVPAGANIFFGNSIFSNTGITPALAMDAGTAGAVTVNGNIGGTGLGPVTITGHSLFIGGSVITVGQAIDLTSGSGGIVLTGMLDTIGNGASGGAVDVAANGGTVTTNSTIVTGSGAVTVSGSAVTVANITTTGQDIDLTSGSGGIVVTGNLDTRFGNTFGGSVDLTANAGGIATGGGIFAGGPVTAAGNGVTIGSGGVQTFGTTIALTSGSGGIVLDGQVSTTGNGALGGAVTLTANGGGNVTLGGGGQTIRTAGGAVTIDAGSVTSILAPGLNASGISTQATNVAGGINGGAIDITTTVGGVTIGGTLVSSSGSGGTAGNVTIASAGDVTLGAGLASPTTQSAVSASGFSTSGPGKVAGNGGNVSISGADISVFGTVFSSGGQATAAGSTGNGGNAGTITLAATGAVTIGTISDGNLVGLNSGGGGSLSGSGGNAGAIFVSGNTISASRILASGGGTISVAGGGSDGAAGNGGSITLVATASSGNAVTLYGNAESPTDVSTNLSTSFVTLSARGGIRGQSSTTQLDGVIDGTGGSVTIGSTAAGATLNGTAVVRLVDDSVAAANDGGATVRIAAGGAAGNPNGSILINGPVEAATANVESLRISTANTATMVAGDIGAGTALNSLVFGTGLNNNIVGGNLGAATLAGPVTVGTQIVDLRNTGNLTFNGFVTTPNLTLAAGTTAVAMNAGANFTGTVSGLSSVGSLTLGGTFGFTGTNFSLDQTIPLTLSGATTINTPNGGITLAAVDGTTPGGQSLTLNAASGSTVQLNGDLGSVTPLGAVTVNGFNTLIGGSITTAGGAVTINPDVVLTTSNAIAVDTTAGGTAPAGANIFFGSSIDQQNGATPALTMNAGSAGAVTLSGHVADQGLGPLSITGSSVFIGGDVFAQAINLTGGSGGITTAGQLNTVSGVLSGGAINLIANAGGNVTANGGIFAGGPLTVAGNGLVINFVETAGSAIALTSGSGGILVNGGGGLSLATNLNNATTGSVSLTANTGGSVTVDGDINTGGALSLAANAGGNVAMGGNLFAGGPVTISGNGVSANNVATTGQAIGVTSGSGGITTGILDTTDGNAVGGSVSLTANGGNIVLNNFARTNGDGAGGGAVNLTANGGGTVTTNAGIFAGGPVTVAGNSLAIDFVSTVGQSISLTSGSGGILVNGSGVGLGTNNNNATTGSVSLTANAGGNVTLAGQIVAGGPVTVAGNGITMNGAFTFGGPITMTSGSGGIVANAFLTTNGGSAPGAPVDLTANAGGNVAVNGGIFAGSGAVTIAGNAITVASPGISTSGQAIDLTSGSGGMVLDGVLSTNSALGGAVNLTATGGGNVGLGVSGQTIRTAGGAVTIDAGSVTSVASGSNAPGISTAATNAAGGVNGGAIDITTTVGGVTIGGTLASGSGSGGTGGNVTIASAGDVSLGGGLTTPTTSSAVSAAGLATSGPGKVAGNGGNVSINGANISLFSTVSTFGGAVTAAGSTSNGGNAGSITLNATGNVMIGTPAEGNLVGLNSAGGTSLNGTGGNAGAVSVSGNTISVSRILASGGSTISVAGGGSDGAAGNGANVTLAASANSGNAITLYGNAQAPTDTSSSTTSSFVTVSARAGLQGSSSATSLDGVSSGTGGSVTIGGAGGGMLAGTSVIRLVDDSAASANNGGATVRIIAGGSTGNPNGSVLINGPVEATTANDESLRMHAFNASITVAGDIGGQTALNSLVFGTGRNLGPNEGSITLHGPVTVGTQIVDQRASGSLTFNGFVTTPAFTLTPGTLALAMNAGANFTGTVSGLSSVGFLTLGGTFGFTGPGLGVNETIPLTLSGPTTINTPNGGITLAAVDGATAAGEGLSLNAGGAVTLDGPLGGSLPLGAVTVNGSSLSLGGNITTAGGAITLNPATTLTASAALDTTAGNIVPAGAAITFGGSVDGTMAGAQALTLSAGSGAVALNGALGSSTPLGAVTANGGALTVGSVTTAGQTIALTSGGGGMVLDGLLNTAGNGGLGGAVTLTANGGGNVGLGVNGQTIRTAGGQVTIDAGSVTSVAAGNDAPTINTAATNAPGGLNGGAISITTTAGGVSVGGTLNTMSGSGGTSGNVTIASAGDVSLGAGLTNPLTSAAVAANGFSTAGAGTVAGNGGNVSISGGNISLFSNVSTFGGAATAAGSTGNGGNGGTITLNATGAVTIGTPAEGNLVGLNSGGGSSLNGAGGNAGAISVIGGTISASRILASGGNTISVAGGGSNGAAGSGANVTLAATATSGNAITFYGNAEAPTDVSNSTSSSFITVSARSGLQGNSLATSLDGTIGGTGGAVTIGGAGGGHLAGTAVVRLVDDSAASANNGGATVRVIAGGASGNANGSVLINGPVEATTANVESLRLHASNASTTVNGDVGGATALNSLVFGTGNNGNVGAGNQGAITLLGPVSVGTQVVDLRSSGSLAFDGLLSTPKFLMSSGTTTLTMTGGGVFSGPVTFSGGALSLGGNYRFTGGSSVDLAGALTLNATTTLDSSAGNGTLTLRAVDGTTSGVQSLTVNAGTGSVFLDGAIGSTTPLNNLTVTGGAITTTNNITTQGAATFNGPVTFDGIFTTLGGFTALSPIVLATSTTINAGSNPIRLGAVTAKPGVTGLSLNLAGSGTDTIASLQSPPITLGLTGMTGGSVTVAGKQVFPAHGHKHPHVHTHDKSKDKDKDDHGKTDRDDHGERSGG